MTVGQEVNGDGGSLGCVGSECGVVVLSRWHGCFIVMVTRDRQREVSSNEISKIVNFPPTPKKKIHKILRFFRFTPGFYNHQW